MIIWALFDSGNGSYYQVAKDMDGVEIYSIGIDRENKNDHFINLDLADYSRLFGDNKLFDELDELPKPPLVKVGVSQALCQTEMRVGSKTN